MAPKTIRNMDFETLVKINKEVVALTGEPHQYTPADSRKLSELVEEVAKRADNQDPAEAVLEKAALLVFKVASGQYFRAGNKRSALVAGMVFLAKNGYSIDITSPELASMVDRVGVAAATLDELYDLVGRLAERSKVDRRKWDTVASDAVKSHKELLAKLAA